jgi:hypothetical protein
VEDEREADAESETGRVERAESWVESCSWA